MNIFEDYGFEIATIIIAIFALISAERAIRIAKAALKATRDSNLVALRIRLKESLFDAERSFLTLQSDCQRIREQWEMHHSKHSSRMGGAFSSMRLGIFDSPKEIQDVLTLERNGRMLLAELRNAAPSAEADEEPKLERFIGIARGKSLEIERLRLRLEQPRPFPH